MRLPEEQECVEIKIIPNAPKLSRNELDKPRAHGERLQIPIAGVNDRRPAFDSDTNGCSAGQYKLHLLIIAQ